MTDGWTQIYSATGDIPHPLPISERRVADDPDVVRAFAEEYVACGDAEKAARAVKWIDTRYSLRVWARRLLERDDVRLEVLMARAAGITERRVEPHSREAVVETLDEITEGAVQDGAWSAATGAVTTKARVLGYMDTQVNIRVTSARELSLEQLRAMVAALPSPEGDGGGGCIEDGEYTPVEDGADA